MVCRVSMTNIFLRKASKVLIEVLDSHLLLVGKNSKVMVDSIGILPPTPNPTNAARVAIPARFEGPAFAIPKIEAIKQVR